MIDRLTDTTFSATSRLEPVQGDVVMGKESENLFFYDANTQYENLGDLIIHRTLIRKLRTYGRVLVDDRGVPEWFCRELELTSEERNSQCKTRFKFLLAQHCYNRLLRKPSNVYFILTPGHIYNDKGEPSIKQAIRIIAYFGFLKLIGVRASRFGASIGPFSKIGEFTEKWKSRLMYFYSVRDSCSEEYARKIDLRNVERFPDLAWLLEPPNVGNSIDQSSKDCIIFSFREASNKLDDPDSYKKKIYPVLDKIVDLAFNKWNKRLVVTYQVERDKNFCKEISERYKTYGDVTFIDQKVSSETMYDVYSRASMVFSNRLHVLMFSMVSGALPVAVIDAGEHNKITGIFSDAELNHLIIDLQNGGDETESLKHLYANSSLVLEEIALKLKQQRAAADAIFDRVLK